MTRSLKSILFAISTVPLLLSANMSVEAMSGIWYEPDYGEQTVWLYKDGRCRFVRAKVTLFDTEKCRWNTNGEMILNYHGQKGKVFMLLEDETLMMSQNPSLISKYTAETLLKKTDDPQLLSEKGEKPLLGKWEARDHSMQLYLLDEGRCRYLQGSDEELSHATCQWRAGKEGATLVFTDPEHSDRNTALFVKRIGDRLLADKKKSNLIPTRAKMQMVRLVPKKGEIE